MIKWTPKQHSNIAIVGEAPGRVEEEQGTPFIGPEGKYLTKMLAAAGITKADCYVTNVVHKRPPRNFFDALPQRVIDEGIEILRQDLSAWKPNVVIALGAHALKALTGKDSIYKYRGTVLESTLVPGLKVFPTLHPGALIRGQPQYEPIVIHDLAQAKDESEFPEIRYPERNIHIIRDSNEAKELFYSYSGVDSPVAADIETIGPKLTAYGFAPSRSDAYVVTKECLREAKVLRALSYFADSATPKIFHNGLYDCLHNSIYYNIFNRNFFFDTMLAQHAAMPVLPKSLGFCASIYTKEVYWKDEGKDFFKELKKGRAIDWEAYYIYNGKDCCLTFEVYEQVQKQLDYWKTWPTFELMMGLVYPCLRAMHEGILVDQDSIAEFAEENEKAIENLYKISHKVFGDFNVRSPKQKSTLLYDVWKLPKQKNKGKITTSRHALETLEKYPTPHKAKLGLIRVMMDYLKRRDFYNLKLDEDGRIRTALKIHGTYTGRMASSEAITGSGKNLLNIPKKTRKFYVADPGKIFIQMDLSQAEARVVAALCQDEDWLKEFDTIDLHSKVASQLYNIPIEKVRKAFERQTAKKVSHATHYLLGWNLLSKLLSCSAKEAKAHKAKYLEIRPKLEGWHESVRMTLRRNKMIRTPFGRAIQFPGPINDDVIRHAVAAEPQSTSADYLNYGIKRMYEEGPEEFEFNLQVYDSILCQVPNELSCVVRTIQAMKELTEITLDVHGVPLVIPTDYEIGYDWLNLNEIESAEKSDIEKVFNELQMS